MKLKYLKEDLRFLKALWSPFKPFGLKVYAGKIAIGTPYFFPRRWRKLNEKEVIEKAKDMMEKQIKAATVATDVPQLTLEQWIKKSRGFMTAVPRKFGFDFVRLGWKTKWSEDDYRFEWTPRLSFVFFKWQIVIIVEAPEQDHYWESWLYYEYNTDKRLPKWVRINQCKEKFPKTYKIYHKSTTDWKTESEETVDYYTKILKPNYL